MKSNFQIFRFGVVLLILLSFCNTAYADRAKRKRKGQLMKSINEAVERSNSDQERIQIRFDVEADERKENWDTRKLESIEIKHTGTSTLKAADLGEADYFYDEEIGRDQSGLDSLHSDVIDEPTDINFDEELRDVSSLKD